SAMCLGYAITRRPIHSHDPVPARHVLVCSPAMRRRPSSPLFPYTTLFRSGVKFHDGADFTAEDVVFSIDRARSEQSNLKQLHAEDRKSTRLNSSHVKISYAVFCLKKKKAHQRRNRGPKP